MAITADYDHEADALYVRLSDRQRSRSVEIDDVTFVDLADDDEAVGIEFLYPSVGLDLGDAIRRFALEAQGPAILAAINDSRAPVAVPTMTGGAHLASSAIVTFAIEGTVPAARGLENEAVAQESVAPYQSVPCLPA